jgi:lycopene cyclase domain-containing protein
MKYTYLVVNFFSAIVPFLFSFHPKIQFHKYFKTFVISNALAAMVFILWDALFTHWGVWGFNNQYILGFRMLDLPIEEILFFVCIPFACLFTIHCLAQFFSFSFLGQVEQWIVIILASSLLIVGFMNMDKAYTASVFITCGGMLLMLKFMFRVHWLPHIFGVYPLLLIPFFIVNGILTGTGLEAPVVWYNNQENLGIRLATIPVEDIFYGLGLILLNMFFFEKLKIKLSPSKHSNT